MSIKLYATLALSTLSIISASAQNVINVKADGSGHITAEWDGANPSFIEASDAAINFLGSVNGTSPGDSRQAFLAFDLPTLSASPTSAIISFDMRSTDAVSSAPWFNIDAYGFTTSPSTTDSYIGSNDTSKTKLADDLITPSTTNGETISFDIAPYLNTLYTGGTPTVTTVYIRLNPDDSDGDLGTDGDGFGRYRPILFSGQGAGIATLSIVPEPSAFALYLGTLAIAATTISRKR